MKQILLLAGLFIALSSQAQMVFLTEDKPVDSRNGYGYRHMADGFAVQGGEYFFITPNSNFFRSGGTEKTTKRIKQFNFESEPWRITATNKYIYYTVYDGTRARLNRSNIATGIHEEVLYDGQPLYFGSGFDQIFVKPGQTGILLRLVGSKPPVTVLYSIDDADGKVGFVAGEIWGKQKDYTVNHFTDMANIGNEVFINGTDTSGTTTIASHDPDTDGKGYHLKAFYSLRSRGFFIKSGFINYKGGLYIIALEKSKNAGMVTADLLQLHSDTSLKLVSSFETAALKDPSNSAYLIKTEVVNGRLFVQCGAELWRFKEDKSGFEKLLTKPNGSWFNVSPGHYLQQCGQYLVYSGEASDTDIRVRDLSTGKETKLPNVIKAYEYNNRLKDASSVYVTGKYIYYFSGDAAGKEILTRYDPVGGNYTTLPFPELKKYQPREIRCASFQNGVFIFYVDYVGKKDSKNCIFMLKEE